MPTQPDITVFIPVRNCERFIGEAIESVLGQTYTDLKLVVADNCSDDATPEVVGRYLDDPRVLLVRREQDLGHIGNFNACLESLDTPYYMILCSDDVLYTPRALERASGVLDGDSGVPAVYSDLVYIDEGGRTLARRRFGRYGRLSSRELGRRSVISTRNWFGIPVLVRSEAARGYRYDRDVFYAADVDFSLYTARGGDVYRIDDLLIANRYHDTNLSRTVHSSCYLEMRRIAEKHGIELSPAERLRMHLNRSWVSLQKAAFLLWVRVRGRFGAPG